MNLAQLVIDRLDRRGEFPALVEPDDRVVPAAALGGSIRALAAELARQGLVPGDRAVLQLPNGAELVAATVAVLAAGAVPVLLEPGLGDAVYAARIGATEARWLVTDPLVRAAGRVAIVRSLAHRAGVDIPPSPPLPNVVQVTRGSLAALPACPAFVAVARDDCDPAVIVFTSGTTGAPRAVVHTHGSLRAFVDAIDAVIGDRPCADLVADTLPQVMYALALGRTAYPTRGRDRVAQVRARLWSGRVDSYFGAPWLWRRMLDDAPREVLPTSVRTVLLGSAPVTRGFLRDLQAVLPPGAAALSIYGLTEAGPVCVATLDEKLAWAGDGDFVGHPVAGALVTLDDETGEVLVRGPAVCAGYLGAPLGDAPLRTGDIGRLVDTDAGRALVLLGRAKEMIVRRGVNLYPGLLEPPIRELAAVRGVALTDCALVGVWNEARQDEDVVLVAVSAADERALMAVAADAVGADGAPDRVVNVGQIPVHGRQNKRDVAALRALAGAAEHPPRRRRVRDAVIPFGFGVFARKYVGMLQAEQAPGRVLAEAAFRLALFGVSQSTWALDEVVAPHWRDARGLGPLFVIGHQRSGTTFLHRLLAMDVTHARALALHEMLVPAVSFQEVLGFVTRLDAGLGSPLAHQFKSAEERVFGSMDPIHRLRLEEVEEDEFTLWAIFASIMVANDAPAGVALRHLDELRHFDAWSADRRARVLNYYRDALTRRLHRDHDGHPDARWIVSKNPAFSQKIPELMSTFPDARFVYLVRDPLQAITSRLSMLREIWRRRIPSYHDLTPAQVDTMLEDSFRTYLFAERDLAAVPDARKLVMRHDDLRADPSGRVHEIYAHFRLPGPDAALEAALGREVAHGPPPKRALDASEFLVDEARVRRELAVVFERYRF